MKARKSGLRETIYAINIIFRMLPFSHHFARIEKYCKACLDKNPSSYNPRWFLADLYKDQEKYEEAKKEYQELQQCGYLKERDYLGMAEVLCMLGSYEDVKKVLTPIIDKYVKHKRANWSLAVSYMNTEEFNKAAVYFERLIAAGSRRCEDYGNLGFCYDRFGNYEKAKEAYLNALSINPDSRELRENLAVNYINTEEFNKAVIYFESVIAEGSRKFDDYRYLGFCYLRLRDFEKAKEAYSKALSIKPDSKEVRENLAWVYAGIGIKLLDKNSEKYDLAGAEVAFRKALDINPGDTHVMKLIEGIQEMNNCISSSTLGQKG